MGWGGGLGWVGGGWGGVGANRKDSLHITRPVHVAFVVRDGSNLLVDGDALGDLLSTCLELHFLFPQGVALAILNRASCLINLDGPPMLLDRKRHSSKQIIIRTLWMGSEVMP